MDEKKIEILLIDDEQDVLDFLRYNFEKHDYIVHVASDGESGKSMAEKIMPDLIILDVMMPGIDGMEVCRELREIPEMDNSLIIFLTARGEDYSEIAGFEVGADDYISKPIRPRVLIARVKALLKRKHTSKLPGSTIEIGNILIDKDKREVIIDGQSVHLPKIEYNLLVIMASSPGKIFSRDELYHKIWGAEVFVGDRTLDVHIRKLREKIGNHHIKTIKGVGYGYDGSK